MQNGCKTWYTCRRADAEPPFYRRKAHEQDKENCFRRAGGRSAYRSRRRSSFGPAGTGEQQCERRHPEQQCRERGRSSDEQRTQYGYAALVEDGALSDAAAVRAREIARSFSHTRPSGASFSSALSESGVTYLRAGENIASGQKSASEVVNAWMNSPGHRANILNSSYSRIGSASVNIDGTLYWVQLFAD